MFFIQKKIKTIALTSLLLLLCHSCFLFKPFIYTDSELKVHYFNKLIKPSYHYLTFLNKTLHYAKISTSDTLPLLIFIHGAPGAWYGYLNLMDDSLLQKHFTMISADRLGYGKSNYSEPELSTQIQALSILHIIEQENKNNKKVYLLGRSYGAPIAAAIAINYPQLVAHLFMISPVIDPKAEKFYWFSSLGKTWLMRLFLPSFLNVATKEKYAHVNEMKIMESRWRNLFVPSTVIIGEKDRIADTANFSFAKKNLLMCPINFYKLKNTGHLVTYEQPDFIKQLLLDANK